MTAKEDLTEMWMVVELMGHRRMAGKVSEHLFAGAPLLRIDVPGTDDQMTTQFYSPAAIYCLTPVTEEIARSVAKSNQPKPVHSFELPQLEAARHRVEFGQAPPGGFSYQDDVDDDEQDIDDDERGF